MHFFWILWTLLFGFFSLAKTSAVIKAPQTSMEEFQTYIQTESEVSYAMHQLQKIRESNSQAKLDLQLLLEQAQEGFLKDHLKNAGELFRTITKKAYQYDWDQESQDIIFYAFLRLAHIEWKGESPEVFLHSAILFAPHKQPDESLFPPPLVQKFNDLKKQLPLLTIHWNRIFSSHDVILVNGKEVSADQPIRLPYGEYRVTALSSAYKKWSRKRIAISHLVQKKIITPAFVRGSCQQLVMQQSLKQHRVLFPHFCITSLLAIHTDTTRAISQKIHQNIQTHSAKNLDTNFKKDFTTKKNHWWTYSKWTLLGAGLLAGAFFIFSNDEGHTIPPSIPQKPTVTIGF